MKIRAKRFGARQVLRDVAFSVARGEVAALFGASGSGKTTALRIALGLDRAFEGSARLDARRPGIVFQEPRLAPWLKVADNLRLVCPGTLGAAEIARLLEEVMLGDVAGLWPDQLSLGMARRVSLARALAADPDALVLDEPFASLDAQLGAALASRIAARARRSAIPVLLSTHDLDQALAVADRILVLAGEPATLAGDHAVRAGIGAELRSRFAFLGGVNQGAT